MLIHILLQASVASVAHRFGGAGSGAQPFATNITTSVALANLPGAHNDLWPSTTPTNEAPTPAPLTCTAKNASVLTGAKFLFNVQQELPADVAQTICCSVAMGLFYTNTYVGPAKKHRGQGIFICTVWGPSDPNVPPKFAPGNSSVMAGQGSPRPPPADPKCTSKKTIHDCLAGQHCSWSGSKGCTYGPPLECGNFAPLPAKRGPFCVGIVVVDSPYTPGGPAGRVLNSFNWTTGTIDGSVKIDQEPPQILKLGQNGWFSTEVDPSGWEICVYYNELLKGGSASDPRTGFVACASLGGGMLDLTRGTTPNMDAFASYGGSSGWNESGYDPHASTAMWGQFIFWSNSSTTVTTRH